MTIHLNATHDVPRLCARTTNRLRNTIDRERRRKPAWEEVEVRALFGSKRERLTLSGFVHMGDVGPKEFACVLAGAWSVDAVRVEPFDQISAEAGIREFGARWRIDQETALPRFRSMRLTLGPRWAKATRHWSPVHNEAACLEPLPVSFGLDGMWL